LARNEIAADEGFMTDLPSNRSFADRAEFGRRLAALGEFPGLCLALALVGAVAGLDYLTGYEIRLSILYMLPIALATWTGGMYSGLLVSMAGVACWVLSFDSKPSYAHQVYYYWEGGMLIVTFYLFVRLIWGLRKALARADERFLHMLEGLHAGVYVVDDSSGRVLYANRRLAHMIDANPFSVPATAFEGRFNIVSTSTMEPPATRPPAGGAPVIFHSDEAHDEETDRWYLIQSGPIHWENNAHVTLKVVTDISGQKQAQILQRQHQEMLHNNARFAALAEIASTLAHEINQPLMAIASYHEACMMLLSKENCDTGQLMEALQKSRAQTLRASQIIATTRGFLHRRAPSRSRGNMNEAVADAVQFIELELRDAQATVDLQLSPSLPDAVFDRTLIVQVIINLLHNGVDAMQSVTLFPCTLIVRTGVGSEGEILVSVIDRGSGIPETVAEKLYTPFFSTKAQGLGLGLCICRSVIEAHAGRLWHTANPGGGTSFHFTLPVNQT
jgi:signal transduction histidine kinase